MQERVQGNLEIREPTEQEVFKLIEMGIHMWAESTYKVTDEFDIEAVKRFGKLALSHPDFYVRAAVHKEHGVLGMMVGQAVPYFFCPKQLFTCDHLIYVNPDKRGGIAAARLIKDFIEWSKGLQATEVKLGITTGVAVERTAKLFERLGLTKGGELYTIQL